LPVFGDARRQASSHECKGAEGRVTIASAGPFHIRPAYITAIVSQNSRRYSQVGVTRMTEVWCS
jgi:hypothetical protein